jgi:hypothetical protein
MFRKKFCQQLWDQFITQPHTAKFTPALDTNSLEVYLYPFRFYLLQ